MSPRLCRGGHTGGCREDRDLASPDRLNRFRAESTATGVSRDSGILQFDGSGAIMAAGAESYVYDGASRLVSGTAAGEHNFKNGPCKDGYGKL